MINSSKITAFLIILFTIQSCFCRNQIITLQKKEITTQLIVDGKLFLIFRKELGGSSATSLENKQAIWTKLNQEESSRIKEDLNRSHKILTPLESKLFSAAIKKNRVPILFPDGDNAYDSEWRIYAMGFSNDKAGIDAIRNAYGPMKKSALQPNTCQKNEQKYSRDNNVEFLTKCQKNKLVNELNRTALKLSNHLLSSPKYMKYETSFLISIHYAEVCAAYGVSKFAQQTNNTSLMLKLLERYKPLQKDSIAWKNKHVDGNVYGILPFQFYQYTKDKNYLEHGLFMANSQWKDTLPDGMTNQTRYWIDDVFMVSSLQINAYQTTKNQKYLDNAALFTAKYIDSLQQENGLFFHGPKAPIYWGRGNGWMAAGMAITLSELNKSHKYYPTILKGYKNMMETLVNYQNSNGMWKQIVDMPNSWDESSCTAMFSYALSTGINKGILTDKKYKEAVLKAWNALKVKINKRGRVIGCLRRNWSIIRYNLLPQSTKNQR